jgi:hypothetical protein
MRGAIGVMAIIHSLFAVMFWLGMETSDAVPEYAQPPLLVPGAVVVIGAIVLGVVVPVSRGTVSAGPSLRSGRAQAQTRCKECSASSGRGGPIILRSICYLL